MSAGSSGSERLRKTQGENQVPARPVQLEAQAGANPRMSAPTCEVADEINETIQKNRDNLYSGVAREMLRKHQQYCETCKRRKS